MSLLRHFIAFLELKLSPCRCLETMALFGLLVLAFAVGGAELEMR